MLPTLYMINYFIYLLAAVVGIVIFRKLSIPLKLLAIVLISGLIMDTVVTWLTLKGTRNLSIGNLFIILEFSLFTYFFHQVVEYKLFKRFALLFLFLVGGISIYYTIINKQEELITDSMFGIHFILYIAYSLVFLYQFIKQFPRKDLMQDAYLWPVLGILFYAISSGLIIISFFIIEGEVALDLWQLTWIFRIILNLTIILSFYLHIKSTGHKFLGL